MLEYRLIQTQQKTKMLAIILDNALQGEKINKEAILKAIRLLYADENAEIKNIALNDLMPHLDTSACYDYKIEVLSKNKTHYCYNLGCCFLDLKDLKTLYKIENSENESLKLLRGERYATHPLYYKDYANSIREKVKAILNAKD